MTADAAALADSSERQSRALRSLGLIAVAAVAMLLADHAMSTLLLVALFAAPWLLAGIPVVAIVLAAALIGLSKSFTGRRTVIGSVTVTLLLAGAGAYASMNGILPTFAVSRSDLPLHVLICGLCAVALGAFVGPWLLRVLGVAAMVGVIAVLSSIPTSAEVAAIERAEAEAQQRRASIDYLLDHGASPMVTDLEGWSNPRIHPTGSAAMTWVRSEAGAVATVLVSAEAEEPVTGDWCTFIARDGDAASATADALPDWCVRTETGWARADGTGAVFFDAGSLIAINPAAEAEASQAGGVSSATAHDIALLAESLRPMTDDELHEYVVPVYDAVETPVIDTPGL